MSSRGPGARHTLTAERTERDVIGTWAGNPLHVVLSALTGNPVMQLFVDILNQVARRYARHAPRGSAVTGASLRSPLAPGTRRRPDPARPSRHLDTTALYLAFRRATAEQLHPVRRAVEPGAVAGMLAQREKTSVRDGLPAAAQSDRDSRHAGGAGHELFHIR
ncbi:MAG TPA: hypothetical protein VHC18_01580 [Amycolatopsis sp.]|nr:hypothetical protein [Amycolatopsis sp.]